MNAGIAQGFIRFGSVAHHILLYLHEHGASLGEDMRREATQSETVQISATLGRLKTHGFVRVVGRDRKPGFRSHKLYDLETPGYLNGRMWVPLLTPEQRQKNYRERKKVKVSSVFDFRGKVEL